jgi:hypothetical protein
MQVPLFDSLHSFLLMQALNGVTKMGPCKVTHTKALGLQDGGQCMRWALGCKWQTGS